MALMRHIFIINPVAGNGIDHVAYSEKIKKTLSSTGLESSLVTKALDRVQKRREGLSYSRRKSSNQYDDVVDTFRKIYYNDRESLLDDSNLSSNLSKIILPTSITHIGNFAFARCKIEEINITEKVEYIGRNRACFQDSFK